MHCEMQIMRDSNHAGLHSIIRFDYFILPIVIICGFQLSESNMMGHHWWP